ncbi:trypsin-7-like isoform X1 [Anopheles albimanus]|uniref:trypsin-7-like isoform X1 n=1 Tax=Anopheles albimanus TaxID=7167 RepID=UPI00163E0B78|nr:trypsin-7-like isoform X1 [Anopheles albimanus]
MRWSILFALLIGTVSCATIGNQQYYYSRQPALFRLLMKYRLWPANRSIKFEKPLPDPNAPTPFIFGGESASIDDYPYQLSLRHEGTHVCGASIIAEFWALSAAHCLDAQPFTSGITLRGGSPHRLAGGYVFEVDQYLLHPKFNRKEMDYDVALIRVKQSFFIDLMRPVSLADTTTVYPIPSAATVIGWGTADAYGYTPLILQSLVVYVQSRQVCDASWIDQLTDRLVDPTVYPCGVRMILILIMLFRSSMLCAGGGEVGKDVCNGDSGGPLILNGYQIGIVSWGNNTCAINLPGVYTSLVNDEVRAFIKLYAGV